MLGSLKVHKKTVHDKIRDKECDLCPYNASYAQQIAQHKKSVHFKIKDNECDKCPLKTSRANSLRKHKKSIHEIIPPLAL